METKQVIVIRKDLNMRKGKMAAQAAHASLGVVTKQLQWDDVNQCMYFRPDTCMMAWLNSSFRKIVVGCDSEEELRSIAAKARFRKLPFSLIEDNGTTEFHGRPTLTALAIGPAEDKEIDEITGGLKLL